MIVQIAACASGAVRAARVAAARRRLTRPWAARRIDLSILHRMDRAELGIHHFQQGVQRIAQSIVRVAKID